MIQKKIIFFSIITLFSCSATKEIKECTKISATALAEHRVLEQGYNLDKLEVVVRETKSLYLLHYCPVDSMLRGNEAEINISKSNCHIVDEKFYQ